MARTLAVAAFNATSGSAMPPVRISFCIVLQNFCRSAWLGQLGDAQVLELLQQRRRGP